MARLSSHVGQKHQAPMLVSADGTIIRGQAYHLPRPCRGRIHYGLTIIPMFVQWWAKPEARPDRPKKARPALSVAKGDSRRAISAA
jgi:hypothetical protein